MRAIVILGVVGVLALSGCASVSEGAASMQPRSAGEPSSVRVGLARILDERVNPSAGVRITAEGDAIVVRFAHPQGLGAVERLNASSLLTISQTREPVHGDSSVHAGAQRVVLNDGRFLVLWKSGDGEHGYRAMAQAYNAGDGSPRGTPAVISPPDADVSGPLSAVTSDGHHVIATFAASADRTFAAYAVPLEAL